MSPKIVFIKKQQQNPVFFLTHLSHRGVSHGTRGRDKGLDVGLSTDIYLAAWVSLSVK